MIGRWYFWVDRILSWGLGFLLVFASLDKLIYPAVFAQSVENYQVVGAGLSALTAMWLPSFEAVVGLMLIVGVWRRTAAFLNAGLMGVFLILVVQAFARGLDIQCGCFGAYSESIGMWKLLENIGLTVAAILLYWLETKRFNPS